MTTLATQTMFMELLLPARMKALAGSGARLQRHLDYLIYQPEQSAILDGGGVPVTVPRAERYAPTS